MNLEEMRVFAELAQSLSVNALLLFFVFYFRQQAHSANERLIAHMEQDIKEKQARIDKERE